MTNYECVVLDKFGEEIDWIDPVVNIENTGDYWLVFNGFNVYSLDKSKVKALIIRERE